MATKKATHVLSDQEQIDSISKRVKRAQGQLGGGDFDLIKEIGNE